MDTPKVLLVDDEVRFIKPLVRRLKKRSLVASSGAAQATFDLTVDGMAVSGLPFGCDGIRRIQCLAIGPNSSNATLYVDSVRVEVFA